MSYRYASPAGAVPRPGSPRAGGPPRGGTAGASGAAGPEDGEPAAPYRPLTRAEIARAVPPGSRRARSQREFLTALSTDPELVSLRSDRSHNIAEVARILARHASWITRTSRPTRQLVCKLARISPSTWKAARRWIEAHGYLGTVRRGWTAMLRAASLVDEEPNEAATYVLCVPEKKRETRIPLPGQRVTRPLTPSRREEVLPPARDAANSAGDGQAIGIVAHLRQQVAELGRGPGRNLTDRHVLAVGRPFLAARYSPGDLAFAIGHDPVHGRHRIALGGVKSPAAWLAYRLSRWTGDPDRAFAAWKRLGHWDYDDWPVPVASPSVRRAQAAEASAAAQAARRASLAAAHRTDPAPFAARIREQLGWTRKPSAPEGPPRVRWIHYEHQADHDSRVNGRPREGQVWSDGPLFGQAWVVPSDTPDRSFVLVHLYPQAPEANYAVDSEQGGSP
ncbi:MAG TPA: hypothetical protein VGG25_31240 [Streptosporangiaceae bacterium]|jgi:hypothetical protein